MQVVTAKALVIVVMGALASQARTSVADAPREPRAKPTQSKPTQSRPTFLLLRTAGNDAQSQRERRFAAELGLALDSFDLKIVEPGIEGFASFALAEQIHRIGPVVRRHQAVATGWLVVRPPGVLLLHVLATSPGRALVRHVETKLVAGCEATLALAARELLESDYLPEPRRAAAERGRENPILFLSISSSVKGGLAGMQGPSTMLGGRMGLDLFLTQNLLGTISFAAARLGSGR